MKRILLVEDEQALARHLTRLLQAEGFTVVHAATQRAAAACLEETPLDLALDGYLPARWKRLCRLHRNQAGPGDPRALPHRLGRRGQRRHWAVPGGR